MRVVMYLRISNEDTDMREKRKIESDSIAHQRWMLTDFVHNHHDLCNAELDELCDDGWSGKNFERPGMVELLEQVKRGTVQCIVVKDFSRFGRDYLTVGNYISRVLPFMGVPFLSLSPILSHLSTFLGYIQRQGRHTLHHEGRDRNQGVIRAS